MPVAAALLIPAGRRTWVPDLVYIDGYLDEAHKLKVKATQYPTESGVIRSDHANYLPERVTLTGYRQSLLPVDRDLNAQIAWDAIRQSMSTFVLFTVFTVQGVYLNMLLVECDAPRTHAQGSTLRFTAVFEEFREGQVGGLQAPVNGSTGTLPAGTLGRSITTQASTQSFGVSPPVGTFAGPSPRLFGASN